MNPYSNPHQDGLSSFNLILSVMFHGLVVGLFFYQPSFLKNEIKPYKPTLRVDLVALPDYLKTEKPTVAAEKPKKEVVAKPKPVVKPKPKVKKVVKKAVPLPRKKKLDRKKKISSALSRIKALAKLDNEKEVQAKPETVIKGNKISKGTVIDGEGRESLSKHYYDEILESVRRNWSLPIWLSRQERSAKVSLALDNYGQILSIRFVEKSGDDTFDEAVRSAITQSAPFSSPPDSLRAELRTNGVLLGFPL